MTDISRPKHLSESLRAICPSLFRLLDKGSAKLFELTASQAGLSLSSIHKHLLDNRLILGKALPP